MTEQTMNYLTDDELEKLINDVEMHELLQCPSHVRQEVLEKTQVSLWKKKLQFYVYSVKVCAAAAAAIVILFTLPVEPQIPVMVESPSSEEQFSFTEELSKRTNSICESLNAFSDMLILRERTEEYRNEEEKK